MTKQTVTPGVPWLPNSTVPRADQAFKDGSRPATPTLQFSPTILIDAENATLGQSYQGAGSDQWTEAAIDSIATTAEVFEGTQAFRMFIAQGLEGYGYWGGRKTYPTTLYKGDSIQVQCNIFFPADFDHYVIPASGGSLKFLRFRMGQVEGADYGHNDLYIKPDGGLRQWTEFNGWIQQDIEEVYQKGVWETYEMRVDFDNVAADAGGNGRTIVWKKKNGRMELIMDRPQATMRDATDHFKYFSIFTLWNGGSPKDNTCYVDRFVMEHDLTKLVEFDSTSTYKVIGGI